MGRSGETKATLRPCIPHSKFPQTAAEWAEILALQKQFHSVEVHKWRQILRASVELLDEVRPGAAGPASKWQDGAEASGPHTGLGLSPDFALRVQMGKPFIVPTP